MSSIPLVTRNIPWFQEPWVQILFELLCVLIAWTCLWRNTVSECSTTLGLGMPALNTLLYSIPSQLSWVNHVQLGVRFFTLDPEKDVLKELVEDERLARHLHLFQIFRTCYCNKESIYMLCCNCSRFAFPTGVRNFLRIFPESFKCKILGNILMYELQNMLNRCLLLNLTYADFNRVQQTDSP